MMKRMAGWMACAVLAACVAGAAEFNTLTSLEIADGWKLLFDGKTLDAWKGLAKPEIGAGWKAVDGTLTIGKAAKAGDIITKDRFADFELCFEFRLTKGANSGLKYFIDPSRAQGGHGVGCEFQVLDDDNHPDAKLGRDGNRTVGSLYDILPAAKDKKVNPIGEWNAARIVVKGKHVEHWLNGAKVVDYERGSDAFRAEVAKSKFSKIAGFGEWPDGHLLLQDHNDEVAYRNLKIRALK
jgi:hypothetical protein